MSCVASAADYTICTIMPVFEGPSDVEESLFFPIPALQADTVQLEPRDGQDIKRLHSTTVEVTIGERNKTLLKAAEIRAQIMVTDARITIACSKYDKGGGWIGGVGAIALNAGSKMLAARRRRGKMLVGQIRYPWISAVYAQNKGGWLGSEVLRVFVEVDDVSMRLDLTLPKDVDATAVATELVRRAAAFRLRHEVALQPAERERLVQLAQLAPLVWRKENKEMVGVDLPTFWPVGSRSARIGLEAPPW